MKQDEAVRAAVAPSSSGRLPLRGHGGGVKLFTALALDAVRDLRGEPPTPLLALGSALVARALVPGEMLPVAFALFTAGLPARHLANARRTSHA